MDVLAAIGTVICLNEVASDPRRLLLLLPLEAVAAASCSSTLMPEVVEASSSLKLTRLLDFTAADGEGELPFPLAVASTEPDAAVPGPAAGVLGVAASAEGEAFSPARPSSILRRLAEGEMFGVGWITLISIDWHVSPRFRSRGGEGRTAPFDEAVVVADAADLPMIGLTPGVSMMTDSVFIDIVLWGCIFLLLVIRFRTSEAAIKKNTSFYDSNMRSSFCTFWILNVIRFDYDYVRKFVDI